MRRWLLLVSIVIALCKAELVSAQDPPPNHDWSPAINLAENVDASAFRPSIAADPSGNLHVVWPGHTEPGEDKGTFASNSIFYTMFDGDYWSLPVDIFYNESGVDTPKIYVDDGWKIHVFWRENNMLKHSWAWVTNAQEIGAWETQTVAHEAKGSNDFFVGEKAVHIVYVDEYAELYYTHSEDNMISWSQPQLLYTVSDPTRIAINVVSIAVSRDYRIHVAWNLNTLERGWSPESVWYIHSLDPMGKQWSSVLEIDNDADSLRYAATEPELAVDPEGKVHLFWHRGVSYTDGRFHIYSADGGETWTPQTPSFPGYRGSTGNDSVVFDSAGTMHLLMSAAPGDGISRLYHSEWRNGAWHELEFLYGGEHPSAVMTEGNRLHLVFWGAGGIGYTYKVVSAPRVETLSPAMALEIQPTAVQTQYLGTQSVTTRTLFTNTSDTRVEDISFQTNSLPIVVSILITSLVVIFVVLVYTKKSGSGQ